MKALKTAARRGAMISVAAASALILASCSAGQISQTANQVAAVDGASADSEDGTIAVRDVTIQVTDQGETGVKFTAMNLDDTDTVHMLKSVSVDGAEVTLTGETELKTNCTIVADIKSELEKLPQSDSACISYVSSSVKNSGFALGGSKEVTFTFDNATITTTAAISAPVLDSGMVDRETGAGSHSH